MQALVVDDAGRADEAAVVGEHRADQARAVLHPPRQRRGVEQGGAELRVARLALGVAEADEQLEAGRVVGAAELLEEVEALAVPAHAVVGRELGDRMLAGQLRVAQRALQIGGLGVEPVARQLADARGRHRAAAVAAELLQRRGRAAVQPRRDAPGRAPRRAW